MIGRPPNCPQDLWKRVERRADDECWPWTGPTNRKGYGRMRVNYRSIGAHRLAFMAATGRDPGHLCVLHRCDNPACCNPNHLFLGTFADNNRDRAAKGRSCRGVDQRDAKLTEQQARAIRKRRARGERGIDLAAEYGVTPSAISQIARGLTWRHV